MTSLSVKECEGRPLYEKRYRARGEMENRIKECQLDLFADRTSSHTMRANQLRLWLASFAYVLMSALRRGGLAGTRLADATCGTIRLKLLKIGALVKSASGASCSRWSLRLNEGARPVIARRNCKNNSLALIAASKGSLRNAG